MCSRIDTSSVKIKNNAHARVIRLRGIGGENTNVFRYGSRLNSNNLKLEVG